jgi:hypothetical protein
MGRARRLVVRTCAAGLLWAVLLAFGCRANLPSYPTQGRVFYKGTEKPFNQGWICLEETHPPYTRLKAPLNANGEFEMDATAGEHRACLEPGELGATRAGMTAYLKNVDKKYTVYALSEWKVNVVPNQENHFTLYVTKPGGK